MWHKCRVESGAPHLQVGQFLQSPAHLLVNDVHAQQSRLGLGLVGVEGQHYKEERGERVFEQLHRWSSGTMGRCHRLDPGSIPGRRTTFCLLISYPRPKSEKRWRRCLHFLALWSSSNSFLAPSKSCRLSRRELGAVVCGWMTSLKKSSTKESSKFLVEAKQLRSELATYSSASPSLVSSRPR